MERRFDDRDLALPDNIVEVDGEPWFLMEDVAEFLGFEDVSGASWLYRRHQSRLAGYTKVAKIPGKFNPRRIVSPEGVFMMAILALAPRSFRIRRAMLARLISLDPSMLSTR